MNNIYKRISTKQFMNETINHTISAVVNNSPQYLAGITVPITSSPTMDIFLITVMTSMFITLINKYFTDQESIKKTRSELKLLQKEMKAVVKDDPKKVKNIQQQIMKKNMENMKYAFNLKIMLITMIPLTVVFFIIKDLYAQFGTFFNVLGFVHFGWLGTYITFSVINSILLKKIFDVA